MHRCRDPATWLQRPREEWQKKTLIPKILAQSKGANLHDDDVLVLECDDDTFEVAVMLLEREAKGDGAIERIQEELQQNISIEWLQKAIREEGERLTASQGNESLHNAVGRERAVLALIGYQTTAEGEGGTNETSVGKWLRRRSDSLGTLAKSLFTFNRDNYKSINESETSMSSPPL